LIRLSADGVQRGDVVPTKTKKKKMDDDYKTTSTDQAKT
jgi:hypothetical protein